jgi:hypothetical protein
MPSKNIEWTEKQIEGLKNKKIGRDGCTVKQAEVIFQHHKVQLEEHSVTRVTGLNSKASAEILTKYYDIFKEFIETLNPTQEKNRTSTIKEKRLRKDIAQKEQQFTPV